MRIYVYCPNCNRENVLILRKGKNFDFCKYCQRPFKLPEERTANGTLVGILFNANTEFLPSILSDLGTTFSQQAPK